MRCLVRGRNSLVIDRPFTYFSFEGGTALKLSLGDITNPPSAQKVGPFTITAYAVVDGG